MKQILIIDDEDFIRETYRDAFELASYNVFESANAFDALEKIYAQYFDAILLDIMMPQMDGIMLIEKLLAEPPVMSQGDVFIITNLDYSHEGGLESLYSKYGDSGKIRISEYITKSSVEPFKLVERVISKLDKD